MVDARRQDDQIVLRQPDAHPLVLLAADVEVALAVADVPDLLVLVEVLGEEHLHLVLVHVAHGLGRDGHLVAVLVSALRGQGVHDVNGRAVAVDDAQRGEVGLGDWAAVIVGLALIALM